MSVRSDLIRQAHARDILATAQQYGARLKRVAAAEYAGPCPVCGGVDRFNLNVRKGLWKCRGCGVGGDVIALVQHLEGISFRAAVERLTGEGAKTPRRAETGPQKTGDKRDPDQRAQHEKARWLWGRRERIEGSIAETYLRQARGYSGPLPPTLGFLRANASRVLGHLLATLASKPVALLSATELKTWRDALVAKGLKKATVNRICAALKAALNHAAAFDHRIGNARAWRTGLAALPNAYATRNVILDDDTVRRLVAACYERDAALGLVIELLATCGARFSQVARLTVGDLQAGRLRVMLPRSGKGRNRAKRHERLAVPLPPTLIDKLAAAAAGRSLTEPLLLQGDGLAWRGVRGARINEAFNVVVASCGLGSEVTPYCLRHSAAVRMIKAGTPLRIIGGLLDNSVLMLEKSYSAHITEHAEDIARRAIVPMAGVPADDKVVTLVKRRP